MVKVGEYPIVKMDAQRFAEVIRENIGAAGVSQFDLDRAKIPTGEGTMFELPTGDGSEKVASITGVIIGFRDVRVYFEGEYDGGGSPPDCFSDDCETGQGMPGGPCAECPLSRFGTARNGRGQACSQRRLLFIARPESLLPLVLSLPPTSLANARKYFLNRLAGQQLVYYGVVTHIGLETAGGNGTPPHAKATFKIVEKLDDEITARMKAVKSHLTPHLKRVAADVTINDGDETNVSA